MSASAISSSMFDAFTDPPYWMRTASAVAVFVSRSTSARIAAQTAWASADVAVRPVPIAQIGS